MFWMIGWKPTPREKLPSRAFRRGVGFQPIIHPLTKPQNTRRVLDSIAPRRSSPILQLSAPVIPRMARSLLAAWLALALAACATSPVPLVDMTPASTVSRAETVAIAEAYRAHRWHPTPRNVFHGFDARGIRVDTPDAGYVPPDGSRPGWWLPGEENEGVPYQWGGFDTPAMFDRKVRAGFAAGDIYSRDKRANLDDAVSARACGIDCSGFISRCWRLDRSYSTRELTGLCDELASFADLRTGDLLNKSNVHALLFVKFLDAEKTQFLAYETGSPPSWKVMAHPIAVSFVQNLGYLPCRYRGIRD